MRSTTTKRDSLVAEFARIRANCLGHGPNSGEFGYGAAKRRRTRLAAVGILMVALLAVETRSARGGDPDAAGHATAGDAEKTPVGNLPPAESQDSISFSQALALVSGQNPQIAYASARVDEAFAQVRGARVLWLPSIRAGIYYGKHEGPLQANDGAIVRGSRSTLEAGLGMMAVGGGHGSTLANFRARFDLDATAYWELRNFGLGEAAAREAARTRLEQARFLQVQVMDRVAREIVEANAQSESLRRQIPVAQAGITAALDSYRRNVDRIRGGQGLPIETLQSIQALDQGRREYLRAVRDYNEAQFRLYRALGCPIPPQDEGVSSR